MASTKELSREERKKTKRDSRKALKKIALGLTGKQRAELKEKPRGGVKGLLLGTNQEVD